METFTGNTSDYLWPLIKDHLGNTTKTNMELTKRVNDELSNLNLKEPVTHTGQQYALDDYRRIRFQNVDEKQVNKNFAIDLVAKDPIVVCDQRVVWSSGGGPLGHPKVYINLDPNEVHTCGYSGKRFIKKKFYDEKVHGKAIKYEDYLKEMTRREYEGF